MIIVDKPGLLTSIQDSGRTGYQKYGVVASGTMDSFAHRAANLLVGNDEREAVLEITLLGPALTFEEDTLIAVCGGDLTPTVDGVSIPLWRTILVRKGGTLRFRGTRLGCRCYVALAGGLSIPGVMGSKSTYLRAGIGGFEGRALQTGDQMAVNPPGAVSNKMAAFLSNKKTTPFYTQADWQISAAAIPSYSDNPVIRVIKGPEFELFSEESKSRFFSEAYTVTPDSDRMGYRFKGEKLSLDAARELISTAVSFGTIQVPSDGCPIILLADRQTTGGYPRIGTAAAVDLPLLAQAKPGDRVSFREIQLQEAQALYLQREKELQIVKRGILLKIDSRGR
ncbi:biotin-dependent carboxyltransferase family protein [Peribacillus sp. SCS-37]|uniref:5-oxoprolinase subunit C family protein n=1 Tax=Paraperibacillus esterisolvens TaxID=3115296 RepID=UPI0039069EBC